MADFFDSLASDSFILPGIGTATNRPYEAPIIKGVTGRVEAPVNSNDGSMGVVMRRSMISSYTRRTTFDGSRYGIDLSDFYAFRLNFIPIKDETLEDSRGSLKVYFRDQIAIGAVDTWQDLTGSMSREWDFTKDIVTGAGANLVDYIQNFDSAGAVNQDIVFVRKSLLDIVDLKGHGVTPKVLLFQGATQISSLGEELENISDWKYNLFNGMVSGVINQRLEDKYLNLTNADFADTSLGVSGAFVTGDNILFNLKDTGAASGEWYTFNLSILNTVKILNRFLPSENVVYHPFGYESNSVDMTSSLSVVSKVEYAANALNVVALLYRRNVAILGGSGTARLFYKFKIINESSNFILWYRFGRIDNLPTI